MSDESLIPRPAPTLTKLERLTEEFYAWERRGRGWNHWYFPVSIEPPFVPFLFHGQMEYPATAVDDGRTPTFLSSLFDRWKKKKEPEPPIISDLAYHLAHAYGEPPDLFCDDDSLVDIQLSLPQDEKVTAEAAERFLL